MLLARRVLSFPTKLLRLLRAWLDSRTSLDDVMMMWSWYLMSSKQVGALNLMNLPRLTAFCSRLPTSGATRAAFEIWYTTSCDSQRKVYKWNYLLHFVGFAETSHTRTPDRKKKGRSFFWYPTIQWAPCRRSWICSKRRSISASNHQPMWQHRMEKCTNFLRTNLVSEFLG